MKKFLLQILCWAFGFLVIGLLLMSYNKYKFYGNAATEKKIAYYNNNDEKYNALIFGSSRMYRHVNPVLLNPETSHRIKAYNMSTGGTFFAESLYQFRNTKIDKNIKYVIFEAQDLIPFETNAYSNKILYYHDLPTTFFEVNYHFEDKDWNSLYLSVTHYLANIFYFKKLSKTYLSQTEFINYQDGYYPLEKEYDQFISVKKQRDDYLKDTTKVALQKNQVLAIKKMNSAWENEIKLLKKECENKGVKLILISSLFTEPKDFSFIKEDSYLKVIDFTSRKKFREFYSNKYVYDNGHLNMEGSKIFTKKLAESLNVFLDRERMK